MAPILLLATRPSHGWVCSWTFIILFCCATLGPSTVVVGAGSSGGVFTHDGTEVMPPSTWRVATMPPLDITPRNGVVHSTEGHGDLPSSVAVAAQVQMPGTPPQAQQQPQPVLAPGTGFDPTMPYVCTAQDVQAMQCTNASLLSPSWCRYQNPMIVPRPPLSLSKQQQSLSTYRRRYHCDGEDSFADCNYIRRFVAIQIDAANNASTKLIVVAARTSGSLITGSTVQALNEDFEVAVDLTAGAPFPGVTSVLQVGSSASAFSKFMVYGGNAHSGTGTTTSGEQCGGSAASPTCNDAGQDGCASFVFVEFQAPHAGNVSVVRHGAAALPCESVVESAFFHAGTTAVFAALVHNPTSGAWLLRFYSLSQSGAQGGGAFSLAATWTILAGGEAPKPPDDEPLTFDVITHYSGCSPPHRSKEYSLGGFFTPQLCTATPMVVMAGARRVSVFKAQLQDATVDVKVDALATFFETDPGLHVVDVAPFGQEIAPVSFSNTSETGPIQAAAQIMWLGVVVDADDAATVDSRLVVVQLPEFGNPTLDAAASTIGNPANLPAAAAACPLHEYYDQSTAQCAPRSHYVPYASSTMRLRQLEVRWRDIPASLKRQFGRIDCAPTDFQCLSAYVERSRSAASGLPFRNLFQPEESPQEVVMQYVHKAYGLRHALYASTDEHSMAIFHAMHMPEPCQAAAGGSMIVSQVNELSMMGDVDYFSVTPNGQYLFCAVSRPAFFLSSMERLVEVCHQLQEQPSNQFLQAWRPACDASPAPRLPTVADFLQIASSCMTGTLCPSFMEEDVVRVQDGFYSSFSFELKKCEEGYFCMQGVRQRCPTGFVCPGRGTKMPVLCGTDPSNNYNCYPQGLSKPFLCPNGTLCGVPYLPSIPVPPGTAMTIDAGTLVPSAIVEREVGQPVLLPLRSVSNCQPGEWCGLGRSTMEGATSLLCPADTYCSTPSVVEPTVCNMGGACTRENCTGNAPYCPAGTVLEERCPEGHYCERPDEIASCAGSLYCPAGSGIWQICPAQYYCPGDGAEKIQCPDGYFCNAGVNEPTKCGLLSDCRCEGGCAEPHNYMSIPVLVLVPVGLWLLFFLFTKYNKYRAAKRDKHHAHMRRMKRYMKRRRRAETDTSTYSALTANPDGASVSPVSMAVELPVLNTAHSPPAALGGLTSPGLAKGLLSGVEPGGDAHTDECKMDVGDGREPQISLDMDSYGEGLDEDLGLTRKSFTIDIEFRNLGLKLKQSGVTVLEGVNGCIRNSRVLAVMGPSGAGKSTFVSALADKAPYGQRLGKVFINGVERSLSQYSSRVGFVPQEDIMLRTQTVEETLKHCAATRLPPSWSDSKKHAFVDSTLGLLGLREIRHNVIGDETQRGISGGQRKRVNIGMELVADPTVLIADEPTSGLDSASSMEVCAALRRIAELGITVITVVHQPRFEIFQTFHDVLLLGKGGKTVYFGPSEGALPYFSSLGLKCPAMTNPPDFMLDVISGDFPSKFLADNPGISRTTFLFDAWRQHEADEHLVGDAPEYSGQDEPPPRKTPGLLALTVLSFKRALLQHSRTKRNLAIDQVLVFIAAVFISSVYWGDVLYSPPLPKQVFQGCTPEVADECQVSTSVMTDSITQRGSMICIALSLTGVASTIRVFGNERVVYWREAQALPQPKHTLAYFLGKDLSMVPSMLLAPLFFGVIFLSVTTPRGSFAMYYAVFLSLQWTATAMGYLVSIVSPAAMAQLVGVVFTFSCAMFAGGMPTLKQLYAKIPPLCWLPYISSNRYALEALYVGEIVEYKSIVELQGVDLAKSVYDTFGYELDAYSRDVAIMFLFGLVFRLLAIAAMALKDQDKKR